jgi:hypothetical protein
MKKAIKIDVQKQTLEYITIEDGLQAIYDAIGNECTTFCCPVSFENEDTIYADDDILLHTDRIKGGFIMENWRVPLLGNAIILGTDMEGNSVDVKADITLMAKQIHFISEFKAKSYANLVMGN